MNRDWLLFAGMLFGGLGAVGTAVVGVIAVISTLLTGGSLIAAAGSFVLATLGLAGVSILCAVALVISLARRASLPRSQRVANIFERAESIVPPLASLGLSNRFEPTVAEQKEALIERYVDGELSEAALEAELEHLLDDERDSEPSPIDDRLEYETTATPNRETDIETERE
jgi:hypothetical protein